MTRVGHVGKALLFGAGYVAVAAMLWVFTLGAIGAIDEAGLGRAASVALFLPFMALAESVPIAVVACAALAPSSSQAVLDRVSAWLEKNNDQGSQAAAASPFSKRILHIAYSSGTAIG